MGKKEVWSIHQSKFHCSGRESLGGKKEGTFLPGKEFTRKLSFLAIDKGKTLEP